MVLAQVTLHHRSCDAHSWRLFRWRLATVEDMDPLSAALDLAWGWLSLTPSLPDHYIAAHHSLAHQLLPHPPDTPTLLRCLARFTFPLSTQDLAAQSFALREASAARGYVSRAAVLSSPSITSATRTVLRLPSLPLEPFHGILPHPGATLTTREERLAEVTAQSRSQTANRHVSVDHAFFAARCTPDPWLPLLHPPTDLTLPLLRDALRANARPESPASLRAYALTRQSPPLITTASLAHRRMGKQDNSRLCSRLRATWDFGPWADGFYTRLVIRVATREGFAHPFSTEEGGTQGDGFAQLHYQAPSLVITRAMRPNTSITLPLTVPGH